MRKTKVIEYTLNHFDDKIFETEVIPNLLKQMREQLMGEVLEDVGFLIEAKFKVFYDIVYYVNNIQVDKLEYERINRVSNEYLYYPYFKQQKHRLECEYVVKDFAIPQTTHLEDEKVYEHKLV